MKATPSRGALLNNSALVEVPLAAFEDAGPSSGGRPKRRRMPPLEFWRNERIVYERLPGQECMGIRSVVLNRAERPADAPRALDTASHCMPLRALQPEVQEGTAAICEGISTSEVQTHVLSLPAQGARKSPITLMLPSSGPDGGRASKGILHVLEGRIRCARAGTELEREFCRGDSAKIQCGQEAAALVAAAGTEGAKLHWAVVRGLQAKALTAPAPPALQAA